MRDVLRSRRVGVRFLWRCARMGMWRSPMVRWLVYHRFINSVPVVRKRWERSPYEIMRAAAAFRTERK